MVNKMRFEEIKHTAAKHVFNGTEYHWSDMLDNTEEIDRYLKGRSEKAQYENWIAYFEGILITSRYEDSRNEADS